MVKYKELDSIFHSLADATRRDILQRVAHTELSVLEVAHPYRKVMSLAAVSKHLRVLEDAELITKRRHGRQLFVAISPPLFEKALEYLKHFEVVWEKRLDRLERHLQTKKK